jgi:phosphoribosylanthranilate isomerase
MKYPDNILEVSSLLPDYMGFIFWENHRGILMVSSLLYGSIKKVGVFVNETPIIIKSIKTRFTSCSIARKRISDFCQELRSCLKGIEINLFIQDEFDFSALRNLEEGKLSIGQDSIKKYPSTKPFFLSGGIGLELKAVQEITKQIYLFTL